MEEHRRNRQNRYGRILCGLVFLALCGTIFCMGVNAREARQEARKAEAVKEVEAEKKKAELQKENEVKSDLMFKMENDPRITKVGRFIRKTSIDELPQFWNILKGDMSLVGTRPPTLDEVQKYRADHWRRISIKPGLTGMWQVSGRSQITSFDEIVKLDVSYIDEWSLGLDIKILIKTVFVVLKRKGAY